MKELRIETILETSYVDLGEINGLQGKHVEIVVREIKSVKQPPKKKDWSFMKTFDLGGKLDDVNIKDLAYD